MARDGLETNLVRLESNHATNAAKKSTPALSGNWLYRIWVQATDAEAGADLIVKDLITGATLLTKDSPAAGDIYQLDYSSVGPTGAAISGVAKTWRTNGGIEVSIDDTGGAANDVKTVVIGVDHQDQPPV